MGTFTAPTAASSEPAWSARRVSSMAATSAM